jgi:hypothetical protein
MTAKCAYNPKVQPTATSIDVTDVKINAMVKTAKSVRTNERDENRRTHAAALIAIAAAP